ncbi:hypothetical protein D3C73_1336590 [compost metagenome]
MRQIRSPHTTPLLYGLALGQSLQVSDVPVVHLVLVYWPAGMPSQTSFLLVSLSRNVSVDHSSGHVSIK